MKFVKILSILVILLILITSLIVVLWIVLAPEKLQSAIGTIRLRRNLEAAQETTTKAVESSQWINQMIETNSNKTLIRTEENVLLNTLEQLEISSPEDVMTYITVEGGCKKLKHYINVFENNHKDLPDSKLYVRLFRAIEKFHTIVCGREERYHKFFLTWQDELTGLHENFLDCQGEPDWYELENSTVICAKADSILKCYQRDISEFVGAIVGETWTCIFKRVVNAALNIPCNFTKTPHHEKLISLEDDGSTSVAVKIKATILLFFIIVLYLIYLMITNKRTLS